MSVQDFHSVPALPDRARAFRWGYFSLRLLLVGVLLETAMLLPSGRDVPDRFRFREGEVARERVVAPYDFQVAKEEATLRREQERAAASVEPVFSADARISTEMLGRFAQFQEKALGAALDPDLEPAERAARIRGLGVPLSAENATALSASGRASRVLQQLGDWLHDLYDNGVVAEKRGGRIQGYAAVSLRDGATEVPRAATKLLDRRQAVEAVQSKARVAFRSDPRGVRLATQLAEYFVQPNVVYDQAETDFRRVQARDRVPATFDSVLKDQLIVDANQVVTREDLRRLRSLQSLQAARRGRTEFLYPPVARMLLMLLFIAVFVVYLRMELPAVYNDNAMLSMFTLLTVVVMVLAEVMVAGFGLSEFTVPIALAPLVVATLLEKRPALMFTLMLMVVVTAVNQLRAPFVPLAVMGGITAVYSVSRLRHRWEFGRAFLTIALANIAAILAWDLAQAASASVVLRNLMWGSVNAAAAVAMAYLLLPVVEIAFGLTSDIKLLELSDLNRPLLKRMQLEAAGTYHHSMVVGSLAEAAAEAVGANSLLARVAAYYHDIGKMEKPDYYMENELGPKRSPHDKLAPSMSALVLRSHIADGLEMARRERLPKAVQDAIPEHHGTMVMAWFYDKALRLDPTARREDYCYPGPKPKSKESAILMLADGVESASRMLDRASASRIPGLVARIIEERVHQGQLDECGLTIQDLARIREAFVRVLRGRFHVRKPYPDLKRRTRPDADLRRESG